MGWRKIDTDWGSDSTHYETINVSTRKREKNAENSINGNCLSCVSYIAHIMLRTNCVYFFANAKKKVFRICVLHRFRAVHKLIKRQTVCVPWKSETRLIVNKFKRANKRKNNGLECKWAKTKVYNVYKSDI